MCRACDGHRCRQNKDITNKEVALRCRLALLVCVFDILLAQQGMLLLLQPKISSLFAWCASSFRLNGALIGLGWLYSGDNLGDICYALHREPQVAKSRQYTCFSFLLQNAA